MVKHPNLICNTVIFILICFLGEVISSQSREIERITSNLNIQVDNPVCILNQDTSRNFLSTSDTKQKFKLFMRATRLQDLAEEYKNISSNKSIALRHLREKGAVSNQFTIELLIRV